MLKPSDCAQALRDAELVVHLASRVAGVQYNLTHYICQCLLRVKLLCRRRTIQSDLSCSMFTPNATIALNVLDACVRSNVEGILIASSTCVYPREDAGNIGRRFLEKNSTLGGLYLLWCRALDLGSVKMCLLPRLY